LRSTASGILLVLVLVLVLVLDLTAAPPRREPDLSATVLFQPAWQRSDSFLDYEHEHQHDLV